MAPGRSGAVSARGRRRARATPRGAVLPSWRTRPGAGSTTASPGDATLRRRGATGGRCSTRISRRRIAGGKPARRARRGGGRVTGGVAADDRARSTFEAAIRRDPTNAAAKYNLELLLRRTRATATRQGPGSGSGRWGGADAARAQGRRGGGTDVLASLTFLSPRGGLLALVALVPLAVARRLDAAHRAHRTRRSGCPGRAAVQPSSPRLWPQLRASSSGLPRRSPSWSSTERHRARTESEVFFVVDVSRSMAAAEAHPAGRAWRGRAPRSSRLRAAVPDVPAGLAGLTDRVLPYLFPTLDEQAFAATLGPLRPDRVAAAAAGQHECDELRRLDLARARRLLQRAPRAGGHASSSPTARAARTRRPPWSARSRGPRGCRLLVVRVGNPAERVFGADGSPEAAYAPDPAAADKTRALAEAAGGEAFSEDDLGAAAAASRRAADVGPVGRATHGRERARRSPRTRLRLLLAAVARPASACGSGESGCAGSSRKRKLLRCGLAVTLLFAALIVVVLVPVTASLASTSRTAAIPAGDWQSLRPDAGQQPPFAADADHAGERRRSSSASTPSTSSGSTRTSAAASSRIRSRSAGAST